MSSQHKDQEKLWKKLLFKMKGLSQLEVYFSIKINPSCFYILASPSLIASSATAFATTSTTLGLNGSGSI